MSATLIYEPAGRAREYAPLALNLYVGCTHGCAYCYAPDACRKDRAGFHDAACVKPRVDVIKKLTAELGRAPRDDVPKQPVLLCFTTDPYQPLAIETGITRRAIELLHEAGYPVHVLTKGGPRATADFDLLGQVEGDAFACSLTFTSTADSTEWEPHAALPDDRMLALFQAHARGITTWASLEPMVDVEQTLDIIRATHHYVDLFKVGTLNHHPHGKTIGWADFARRAVALLEQVGAAYYLKNDLRAYLT